MTAQDSRFFSVLAAALGLLAALMALVAVPTGVTALALMAFTASAAGLLRGEGPSAVLGAGLALTALLGPATVLGAALAAVVVFATTRDIGHPRT